jgi:hypothetical protein
MVCWDFIVTIAQAQWLIRAMGPAHPFLLAERRTVRTKRSDGSYPRRCRLRGWSPYALLGDRDAFGNRRPGGGLGNVPVDPSPALAANFYSVLHKG